MPSAQDLLRTVTGIATSGPSRQLLKQAVAAFAQRPEVAGELRAWGERAADEVWDRVIEPMLERIGKRTAPPSGKPAAPRDPSVREIASPILRPLLTAFEARMKLRARPLARKVIGIAVATHAGAAVAGALVGRLTARAR